MIKLNDKQEEAQRLFNLWEDSLLLDIDSIDELFAILCRKYGLKVEIEAQTIKDELKNAFSSSTGEETLELCDSIFRGLTPKETTFSKESKLSKIFYAMEELEHNSSEGICGFPKDELFGTLLPAPDGVDIQPALITDVNTLLIFLSLSGEDRKLFLEILKKIAESQMQTQGTRGVK